MQKLGRSREFDSIASSLVLLCALDTQLFKQEAT